MDHPKDIRMDHPKDIKELLLDEVLKKKIAKFLNNKRNEK
jgi:hypothetical protein